MKEKIKQLEDELSEMTERWKRAAADYQNLEKRQIDLQTDLFERSTAGIVSVFLPVLDQLERAVGHGQKDLEGVLKSAQASLSELGVKTVSAIGDTFDPFKHEAIELAEGDEENKILEIMEQGYEFGKRLIRPAKVKVSKKGGSNE